MANISIRKIDDYVYERLRIRAASHGLSMEEEVRQIIKLTLNAPEKSGDLAIECFGEQCGLDLNLPQHKPHKPLEFK